MKKLLASLLITLFSASLFAGDAIGLRFGAALAPEIVYRRAISEKARWEFNLGLPFYPSFGVSAGGQYQQNIPISAFPQGLDLYWGAGLQLGFTGGFYIGAAPQIGLQYTFSGAPINLSWDYRPCFGISAVNGGVGFFSGYMDTALAVRYTF